MSLLAIFTASLIGSPHCAGMCGGFVLSCTSQPERATTHHSLYHFGRLISYLAFGAVAGFLGKTLDIAGDLVAIQGLATWTMALVLTIMGFQLLRSKKGFSARSPLPRKLVSFWSRLVRSQNVSSSFGMGLLTGLLPCGWLHVYVLVAAGSANPLHGAVMMGVFWLGTLPILLSLGKITQMTIRHLGIRSTSVSAALILIGGVTSMVLHWNGSHDHHSKQHEHSSSAHPQHLMESSPTKTETHSH